MTNIKAIFPLTGLQKGMLYHSLKNPCGTEYVTQQVFKLSTIPDKKHLLNAIKLVSKKFDILRSSILITPETNKEIAVIYKDKEPAFKESVITEYSEISDILREDLKKGFDLQKDSLIRHELIKINNDYYLLISFHHIILDGWSTAIVYQDLIYFYNQLNQGNDEKQLIAEFQKDSGESYQDFIQWLNGQDEQQGLDHWKKLLDGYDNMAEIKPTKSSTDKSHQKIDRISRSCTIELNNKLEKQLKSLGVTHSTLMEMAWGLLLQGYSGSKDVVFGKVVSGREAPVSGIEQMVGLFINTVPVRVKDDACSLTELLVNLQKQNSSGLSYSGNSLTDIQEYCGFNVDLVNTIVVFENYYVKNKSNEEKKDEELHLQIVNGREETNYGLTLSSYLGEEDRLGFDITYQTEKYRKVEVERMLEQLELILNQFSSEPLMKVKDLKRVTSKEGAIISTINQTTMDYPSNEDVTTIFESIVAAYPQKEAVFLGNESWSYSELNCRSNQIARQLLEKGVQHGEAVGIVADRSLSMIAGLIGIVKTGAVYVPIDPKLPENRIKYLVKDANIQIVLTTGNRHSLFKSIPILVLDESLLAMQWKHNPIKLSKPEDLIYVMYTSGTTATPKGVQVTHQNVLSLAYVKSGIELTDESRLLQTGSLAFDASTYEIWGTLLNGGTLILPEEDLLLEPEKLKKLIDDKYVNILFQTTRLFNQIVEDSPNVFDNVDRIIFGGEKAQESIVNIFQTYNNKTQLFNAYGPTETTTYATIYKINRGIGKISLGHPLSNKTIYIEQDGQLCGIGMPGEILIGGDGVSAGYLNNPELTAEKFIENPYGEGRVYRSGDLGRYLPDGSIEYLGRMDDQVKIRGYRIEIGEIEEALLQLAGVKQVAVVEHKTEQDHSLYAYLVGEAGLDIPQLRRLLRSQLPEYMIPGKMMQLESLPMTRNGKLDKKALPEIDSQGSDYVPPKNEVERSLQRMYEEILELTKVSVTDEFILLGGHSLRTVKLVNRIKKDLHKEITISEVMQYQTIREIAWQLERNTGIVQEPLKVAERKAYYEMSPAQQRMFIQQLNEGGTIYNIPQVYSFKWVLEEERLRAAFDELIQRHEILRTTYTLQEGRGVQYVQDTQEMDVVFYPFVPTEGYEAYIQLFDLQKGPLFRARVFTEQETSHLFLDFHHSISDGESVGLFLRELMNAYEGIKKAPLQYQYKDYSEWIHQLDQETSQVYWKNELMELPVMELPLDYPRQEKQSFRGKMLRKCFSLEDSEKIRNLAKENHTTEYLIFMSLVMMTLKKFSGQSEIVLGTVSNGRTSHEVENLLGMFVNTLVMRGKVSERTTYPQFVKQLKEKFFTNLTHQHYPLENIIQDLEVPRDASRNPLFDVMYSFDRVSEETDQPSAVSFSGEEIDLNAAKFDLSFYVQQGEDYYALAIEYDEALFRLETIEYVWEHLKAMIDEVHLVPEKEITAVTGWSKVDQLVIESVNNTAEEYAKEQTVSALFEVTAMSYSEKTAVVFGNKSWSYSELNRRSNQVAHRLVATGVEPGDAVGIVAERSLSMIAGLIGIIKAGAVYVPIDPKLPENRMMYLIEDASIEIVLTTGKTTFSLDSVNQVDIDEPSLLVESEYSIHLTQKTEDLIYVMYTSGTTGTPKGVQVTHQNVIKLAFDQTALQSNESTCLLQTGSLAFDASTYEIWGTLLNGGTLILPEENQLLDSEKLTLLLKKNRVNTLWLTVTLFNQLVQERPSVFDSVRQLTIGGERPNEAAVKQLYKHNRQIRIYNGYGPTETTTFATVGEISRNTNRIVLGRPISNTTIYIEQDSQLCGIGMPGELLIGGDGVSAGYLNNPEMTAEKFIENPYGNGRVYRSGDVGRYLPDGTIEYLGRMDEQVKIRGYRIELGEIEQALLQQKGIKQAAVIEHKTEQDHALHAYLVGEGELSVSTIRQELLTHLPEYMIPKKMMQLNRLPMTQNGKLDKKALPEIQTTVTDYESPKTEAEYCLQELFETILELDSVSVTESFFLLGGDSIKAMRIVSRAREAGYDLKVQTILEKRTIRNIAQQMQKTTGKEKWEQGEVVGEVTDTPILRMFKQWALPEPAHFNQSVIIPTALPNPESLQLVIDKIIEHHDSLRARYIEGQLTVYPATDREFYRLVERTFDSSSLTFEREWAEEMKTLQEGMDLEDGPMVQVGLYTIETEKYLVVIIHHLIVDGVSWRILLEDINNLSRQLLAKEALRLPQKTMSYQSWANKLKEYQSSLKLKKEKNYWQQVKKQASRYDLHVSKQKETSTMHTLDMMLDESMTKKLMKDVHRTYTTEINDILLSALSYSVCDIWGQDRVSVLLEGHGREALHVDTEVDRTVGWFTSMYPIVLHQKNTWADQVIQTKETLREIPNQGIGYGVLYEVPELSLTFNYMGEVVGQEEWVPYGTGEGISEYNRMPGKLQVNGIVTNGCLTMSFSYDDQWVTEEEAERLQKDFKQHLEAIITHSVQQENVMKTPSDFSYKNLTMDQLKELTDEAIEDILPLTPMQAGMFYHYKKDIETTSYVVQNEFFVPEHIDDGKLLRALELLQEKHVALKITLNDEIADIPLQLIGKNKMIGFERINSVVSWRKIMSADIFEGFDLRKGPLFRVKVQKHGNNTRMLISFHHIILDGWSTGIVYNDLMYFYNKLNEGACPKKLVDETLDSNTESFQEYICWLSKQNKEEGLSFWNKVLHGYENIAKISSIIKDRGIKESFAEETLSLDSEKISNLINNLEILGVTLSTFVEVAWGIILQQYNRIDDVVFGKVVSGRNVPVKNIENAVGLFINSVPVRIENKNESVTTLLQKHQKLNNESEKFHYSSLTDILSEAKMKTNFIETIMSFENYHVDSVSEKLPISKTWERKLTNEATNYDVSLNSRFYDNMLEFECSYNKSKYQTYEIKGILCQFESIVSEYIIDPERKVSSFSRYNELSKPIISNMSSKRTVPRATFKELFERTAKMYSENQAIIAGSQSYSYQTINEEANKVANWILSQGYDSKAKIGIMADRSTESVIHILGIIKSGHCLVIFDPKGPNDRNRYMIGNCAIKLMFTFGRDEKVDYDQKIIGSIIEENTANPVIQVCGSEPLCIIHTSGTTGQPKGVIIRNDSIENVKAYQKNAFDLTEKDVVMQIANFIFDAFIWELVMSLLNGAALVLTSDEERTDSAQLGKLIDVHGGSIATVPPVILDQNIYGAQSIERLISVGSEFPSTLLKEVPSTIRLFNAYGPTEGTICTSIWERNSVDMTRYRKAPIGKPVKNMAVYIEQDGQLCGIGMPGEILIGGDGVSAGYLNNPELTAEKFIENPYGEGRVYRSGDLGRYLPDGSIEYLGRMDDQVKIRGYRIEIGEIEEALLQLAGVKQVAVVEHKTEQDHSLYAYLVGEAGLDIPQLRRLLRSQLPEYMIPGKMMQLESLPMTRNGKLDKKALPEIDSQGSDYVPPKNEVERSLQRMYEEILELTKVSVTDEFILLGGHSLRTVKLVNRIKKDLHKEITISEVMQYQTIREIAWQLERNTGIVQEPLKVAERKAYYEMSPAQQRMFIQQLNEGGTIYNIPQVYSFKWVLEEERLRAAFDELIQRHEILRTTYTLQEGRGVQYVQDTQEMDVVFYPFVPTEGYEAYIQLFDLQKGPLFRARVFTEQETSHLFLDFHHSISDGESVGLFLRELMNAYEGIKKAPLQYQYKDYSEWIHQLDQETSQVYWKNELMELPVMELPLDYPRQEKQSFRGKMLRKCFSLEDSEKIRNLAKENHTTEYLIFMSLVMMTLKKFSGQSEIVLGTVSNGRTSHEVENLLGMFVNTLVMRGKVSERTTYPQFVKQLKEKFFTNLTHQHYPLENIIQDLEVPRDASRNPLFDVMYSFDRVSEETDQPSAVSFSGEEIDLNAAKFDLSFYVQQGEDYYALAIEYDEALFRLETIEYVWEHLKAMIDEVHLVPEKEITAVTGWSKVDQLVIESVNNTAEEYAKEQTVSALFEVTAMSYSEKTAVVFGNKSWSYSELNRRSNQVAHRLVATGVEPGDAVGIVAERSLSMIAGLIGIIKAGAVYVPIDPKLPENRMMYLIEDASIEIVLTTGKTTFSLDSVNQVDIDEPSLLVESEYSIHLTQKTEDLIYVMYTSGTTGTPKGVQVTHQNVIKLAFDQTALQSNESTCLLQTGSLAFDASTYEIWGTLLNGGTLILPEENQLLDSEKLTLLLKKNRVNTLWLTVTLFNQLVQERPSVFDSVRQLTIGGERPNEAAVKQLYKHNRQIRIYNGYGPTETTTFATVGEISRNTNRIVLGRPISNTTIYIEQDSQLCGIGMPGELLIGGDGVSAGYLNNPEMTAEKFIENPYGNGRVYRSGDVGRYLPDGTIEYLGRMDEQVKIRGYRIELGEIEQALLQQKGIKQAAVIEHKTEQDHALHAYLVGEGELSVSTIRQELLTHLPEYMIPKKMMQLNRLPMTQNGKLDKKALPEIQTTVTDYESPKTEAEYCLQELFETILELDSVSVTESFFLLGGDSIKAMRIVSRAREAGYDLKVQTILEKRTIRNIAQQMQKTTGKEKWEQGEVVGEVTDTPILRMFKQWALPEPAHFNQSVIIPTALPNPESLQLVIDKIIEHHDSLRARYIEGQLTVYPATDREFYRLVERTFDSSSLTFEREWAEEMKTLQEGMGLEDGPMVQVGLYTIETEKYLVVIIHHLIVDGVSWRILLEDINNLSRQLLAKEALRLPQKTMSYQSWANKLKEYQSSLKLKKEKNYWQQVKKQASRYDLHVSKQKETSTMHTLDMMLDESMTKKLMKDVHRTYTTEINDILLSALSYSVCDIWGQDRVSVLLEGHGREALHVDTEVDRTVGWFTSMYPIVLHQKNTWADQVIQTKETLREIPNQGIGYGVLYEVPELSLTFNYMGEVVGQEEWVPYGTGEGISEYNRMPGKLQVNGIVTNGCLTMSFSYDDQWVTEEEAERLQKDFKQHLEAIITHSVQQENVVETITDIKLTKKDLTLAFKHAIVNN